MSEEEKKAIENLKEINQAIKYRPMFSIPSDTKLFDTILNLIEKQQKEIEELKKPKYLLNAKTGEITTINNSEFISKDKIKAKIEAIKTNKLRYFHIAPENWAINILQSLLEKE